MSSVRWSDAVGELFGGRYETLAPLARGGMGRIYAGRDQETGEPVAVKVLDPELLDHSEFVVRFRREALAASQLGHPHIVDVRDLCESPGAPPAMIMELLEGETAHEASIGSPIAQARAVLIATQVLEALEVAHAAGIIHRDLKPANVFLDTRHGAKILDFGVARLKETDSYGRLTATGVIMGTPRYAAPEQLESAKSVDHRADVYAVGALLYTMLAGRPPFDAEPPGVIIDVMDHDPPPLQELAPSVSTGLAAIIEVAMQKRPSARFATAREMRDALAGLKPLAPAPVAPLATAEPAAPPATPPPRASTGRYVGLALVAVGFAVALLALWAALR